MYTHQDIKEFHNQIKEVLDKRLTRNSKISHTNHAFMVRNHAEKKKRKARMVIHYKELNDNTVCDDHYILNKTVFS